MATAFWGAAALAAIRPRSQFGIGPIDVSLHDASRVAFQAALVSAVAVVSWRLGRWRRLAIVLAVAAVLVTGALDSTPRRVGDGAEYMTMAARLAGGHAPGGTNDELPDVRRQLAHLRWLDDDRVSGLVTTGQEGWDFQHFWLYPAVVAPLVALLPPAGVHPNVAFALVNGTLLLALVWVLCGRGDYLLALLLGTGPLVWWTDKAHAEIFMVTSLAAASLLRDSHSKTAPLAAGIATAQNPAACPVLIVQAAAVALSRPRRPSALAAVSVAVAIAAVHPLYYLVRLGRLSPLLAPDGPHWPSLRALLTPLFDPNLGLVVYAPVWVALAIIGWRRQPSQERYATLASVALLLLAFAQTTNVNHGGSPGMSRYGLWLLAAMAPAAAAAARRLDARAPVLAAVAVGISAAFTWSSFRPVLSEGQTLRPSILASALWTYWPSLDNPLPEVFAERLSGIDGAPPIPVATATCTKMLVRGNGTEAVFPFPCEPRPAPDACSAVDALCYVNQGRFSPVPRHPGRPGVPVPEREWTVSSRERFAWLLERTGADPQTVRLGQAGRVVSAAAVRHAWVVEGTNGVAVWVYPLPSRPATLTVRFDRPADVIWLDADTDMERRRVSLGAGTHVLPLDAPGPVLLVVTDRGGEAAPARASR
ncbi:MAG: hypothetical protein AB7U83_01425 [Vicinamibacterales bacterium]